MGLGAAEFRSCRARWSREPPGVVGSVASGGSWGILLGCDTLHVTCPAPDQLSSAERAFMINASEVDILPGVWGDLDEPLVSGPAAALVPILLSLVA